MPIYEFVCQDPACRSITEAFRRVADCREPAECDRCGETAERIYSAPTVQAWDPERPFPNLSSEGDGTMKFRSREDYEAHLKERGIHELDPSRFGMRPSVGRRVVFRTGPKPRARRIARVS